MSDLSIFQNAKVLITGHTGFKGSWLSLWLAHLGAKVYGISSEIPSEPSHFVAANLSKFFIEDHRLDIREKMSLNTVVSKIQPDFVFHLAAQALVKKSYEDPIQTWETNTMGSINLLESLRNLYSTCIAVLITSDKCYDNVEWPWGYRETDNLGGPDPYSASKGAAELAIRSYIRSYFPRNGKIHIGIGRAGNVIGGGDWAKDRILPDCIRAWSKNEIVQLRNPMATRPWQHVLEPLSGYISLALSLKKNIELHGEPFNFGPPSHQNHSVHELVSSISKYWDQANWKDISDQYGGPYESGLLKLNCDKALHHLNWRAVWDFDTTVRSTISWYRHFYEKPKQSIADFSLNQIKEYTKSAFFQGIKWAK